MCKRKWILFLLCCCHLVVIAQSYSLQRVDISDASGFEAVNRHVSIQTINGKSSVHLNAAEGAGVAWIRNVGFTNGIIEFDVKGKDVLQQSFVGIAFHGLNDSTYDCIYFRPSNFNATDSIRKSHAVQYISMPQYDWQDLREKFPLQYEHPVTKSIDANSWFNGKIVVKENRIDIFVNEDNKPSLIVTPLHHYTKGKIGFWVGNGSDGDFSNLTIQQD